MLKFIWKLLWWPRCKCNCFLLMEFTAELLQPAYPKVTKPFQNSLNKVEVECWNHKHRLLKYLIFWKCACIGRRPKIELNFETKLIWDVPLYINVSNPNLNPFSSFGFDQDPARKMPTYLASRYVCHTNVSQGRSRLFSVILSFSCNFAKYQNSLLLLLHQLPFQT